MQISGVSLALTWPRRLCVFRVLLCPMPLLQAFPFPSTLGEVTLHPLSQAGVFSYSSRGKWAFPPLLWSFLPLPLLQAFPLLVAGCVLLLLPSPAGLFLCSSVWDFPCPVLHHSGCPTLFATCLFCCYCLLFSFFFLFSLGGGQSVQGAMLIWPRVVCGIYRVPLSSPCGPHLPKPSRHWRLAAAWGPSWFLRLM
jgi:hypothetical protein